MNHFIIGTAGHIDHGKSSLVKALTGTDPDRLPEEKKRQITIDLGYAFLDDIAAIIDVPGHEKFIRNMVAGAATIDYIILVIAADDGVMPQTREHLQILRLLGIRYGCIVITKCGIASPERLSVVEQQAFALTRDAFLQDASIHFVDSLNGNGIQKFKDALTKELADIPARFDRGIFRLPVDRVFTMKGHGTVVTGTVLSGAVAEGDKLEILPAGGNVRVKHLESGGQAQAKLGLSRRAALNLAGDTDNVVRGSTLTTIHALISSTRIRIAFDVLPDIDGLSDRQRVRFLIGTQECIGRLQILDRTPSRYYANLLLETPAVATWNDHFILRRYSPMETLGGGRVLEPISPFVNSKNRETEIAFSKAVDSESLNDVIQSFMQYRGDFGISFDELAAALGISRAVLTDSLNIAAYSDNVLDVNGYLITVYAVQKLKDRLLNNLRTLQRERPTELGIAASELRTSDKHALPEIIQSYILDKLVKDKAIVHSGNLYCIAGNSPILNDKQQSLLNRVVEELKSDNFAPRSALNLSETLKLPRLDIEGALVLSVKLGKCRRLGTDIFFEIARFNQAIVTLKQLLKVKSEISVSDVSTALHSSRKYVVPFLEYLDLEGITMRNGNMRVPGRNFKLNEEISQV